MVEADREILGGSREPALRAQFAQVTTIPQSGFESTLSIVLIRAASRWILASASTNQGPEKGDLILGGREILGGSRQITLRAQFAQVTVESAGYRVEVIGLRVWFSGITGVPRS